MTLDEAVALTRTGDLWVFRGRSVPDRAIQTMTNSPVNHVGMAVVVEDLPPMMWHAELGKSLLDLWSGTHRRGVQLHDLRDAVTVWANRYGQRAWLRQLEPQATPEMEDAALRTVARLDGTPFPSTARLAARWARGRVPKIRLPLPRRDREERALEERALEERALEERALESAYCAEVVALTYEEMGLLPAGRRPHWYDPGRFWSGDSLDLLGDHKLGNEITVGVERPIPA
ncbi:hypothetical protein ACGF0J_33845 [Nonomuraea sp. NPDC047897]|uniref:hypothetical protein n=1 Tax=Nonomuraea sp. NPDC047897 TaxID=3364346 RepID=UPI003710C509